MVDGTLVRTGRRRSVSGLYSDKHKDHWVNIQALVDPYGHIVRAGRSAGGSIPDMKSAKACSLFKHLETVETLVLGDKGYVGAGAETAGAVITPVKGKLTPVQEACNKAHGRLRSLGERRFVRLKSWKVTTRFTRSVNLVDVYVQASIFLENKR